MRTIGRCCLVGVTLLAAASAMAQPVDERAQLQQGAEAAYRRGRHAEALDFAMRAGNLGMTPQLRLFIGIQHEALGHTIEALESAERCVRETAAAPPSAVRAQVLERCNQMVEALGHRVGRVVVLTPEPAPTGLLVRMQGAELDASRWRTPVPVLPGPVVVEAVSPDGLTLRREVNVAVGARVEVSLEQIARTAPTTQPAPPPEPVAPPVVAPVVVPVVAPVARVLPPRDVVASPLPSRPLAPWIVAAAGGALAVVGASLIFVRDARVEERDQACPGMTCDAAPLQRATSADDEARAWQTAAYVTMGAGAALAVGGVVWGVVAWRSPRASSALRPAWNLAAGGATLGLTGSF